MKPKRRAKANTRQPATPSFGSLLRDLRGLIVAARAVDSGLVTLYWHVGRRIRQDILKEKRAACSGRRFGQEN